MTEQEIERCLERFTIGKATDVMNFDYAGTFAYIQRLKAENAELKSSLTHANEECLKWHERAQNLLKDSGGSISGYEKKISDLQSENAALRERLERAVELPCEPGANLFTIEKHYEFITYGAVEYRVENKYCAGEIVVCEDGRFCFYTPTYNPKCLVFGEDIFTTREAAEARLAELKGEKE